MTFITFKNSSKVLNESLDFIENGTVKTGLSSMVEIISSQGVSSRESSNFDSNFELTSNENHPRKVQQIMKHYSSSTFFDSAKLRAQHAHTHVT